MIQQNDIGYVLNASNTCPKPDFIPESHFLRVPVNDSFCEKILPWLDKSVDFIGEKKLYIGSLKHFLDYSVCLPPILAGEDLDSFWVVWKYPKDLHIRSPSLHKHRPKVTGRFCHCVFQHLPNKDMFWEHSSAFWQPGRRLIYACREWIRKLDIQILSLALSSKLTDELAKSFLILHASKKQAFVMEQSAFPEI